MWGVIELLLNLFVGKRFWKGLSKFGDFIRTIAIIIDIFGNITMQIPFNRLLITNDGYSFGDRNDTISFVLGINKLKNTLSSKGVILCNILDWFDTDHCLNTVNDKVYKYTSLLDEIK